MAANSCRTVERFAGFPRGRPLEAIGEMGYNDALLEISSQLRMPIEEVVREWDCEIDWQKEWGARDERMSKSAASSGAGNSSKRQ